MFGKKSELVTRVFENINKMELETKYNTISFILTEEGIDLLEKNKRLFMTEREKAGKQFEELSEYEFTILQIHHMLKEFSKTKNELYPKGFSKNDVLWSIYNKLIVKYTFKKEFFELSLIYDAMSIQLEEEGKNDIALHYLVLLIYTRFLDCFYNSLNVDTEDYVTLDNINFMYERHIHKLSKKLHMHIKQSNQAITTALELKDYFLRILKHYLTTIPIDVYILNNLVLKLSLDLNLTIDYSIDINDKNNEHKSNDDYIDNKKQSKNNITNFISNLFGI